MRILVIDDNEEFRDSLVLFLKEREHEVCWAATGHSGLRLTVSEKPDLVILDINLPDILGYEVARQLPRGLPLIIMSAMGPDKIRHDAIAFQNSIAGALLILGKPLDELQMEDALLRIAKS